MIGRAMGFMTGSAPLVGGHLYDTPGTYTFIAPAGVTSVCVVAIGPGSFGGGGLGYKNSVTVIPGNSYTVVVGAADTATNSYFISTATVKGGASGVSTGSGGTHTGDGGGNGGNRGATGDFTYGHGSGAAAGYANKGGDGASADSGTTPQFIGQDGLGGGGAGGGTDESSTDYDGGGVGVYGQGTSGTAHIRAAGDPGSSGTGVNYGGGSSPSGNAGGGAVRIIWGTGRSFPSTNVGQNFGGVTEGHN